jgi:tetratricopeptide (TPR) repeat protein
MYPAVVRLAGDGSRQPAVPIELADAKAAAAWLDGEWHNIFALIRYAGTEGPKDLACQLADSVRGYLGRRGHLADWYAAADIALAAALEIDDKRAQVAALLSRAHAHQTRYVLQSARDDLHAALAVCEEMDWPEAHYSLLCSLGGVLTDMGQPLASIPLLNHAIEIGDRINALVRRTTARINLAYTLVNLGRTAEAVALAEETLRLIGGTDASNPTLLENLGNAHAIRGSYGVAKKLIGQAVTMRRKTEDRRGEGTTLIHLAVIDYDAGLNDEADAVASAVLHFAVEYADRRNETYSNVIAGYVALRAGDLGRADDILRRAQSIATTAPCLPALQARIGLAAVATGRGDFSIAAELLENALATTRANELRLMEGEILTSQARLALLQDDVMQAFALAEEAADLRRSTEHRLGEALSLGLVLKAADRIGDDAARARALSRLDQLNSHLDVSLEDRPLIGAM